MILTRGPCRSRKRRPEPAADVEARGVAEHGAGPDEADQRQQLDLALPGDHAAGDHDRLARRHQPDERARLEEGHHADERVGPRAERLGDVLDHLLRVGQRRQHAARVDAERERQRPRRAPCARGSACASARRRTPPRARRPPRRSSRRADMERGGYVSAARLTSAPGIARPPPRRPRRVREQAEAGGPRAAHRGAERARGAERVERRRRARGAARARRARGRSRARAASSAGAGRRERAERLRVEPLAARRRAGRARRRPSAVGSPSRVRHEHRDERRQLDRLDPLAGARARVRGAGSSWLGTSEPRSAASARSCRGVERAAGELVGDPQRRGGVGAAAAEPGGHRDALVDRAARAAAASPPARARNSASARGGEVRRPPRRGRSTLSAPDSRGAGRELVGEVDRRQQRADRVHAVRRAGDPRGGRGSASRRRARAARAGGYARGRSAASRSRPIASASRGQSSGGSRSARASAGWPSCSSAARVASRMSVAARRA